MAQNFMTQAALEPSCAAQALPTCTAEAGREGLMALPPEISLPLEGLNPEEVELAIGAVKLLCVLIESYNMMHGEEADSGNNALEHRSVLPA
jgi:hypothetical protein